MKQLIIFGAGDIAELAHFYFTTDAKREVAAFTVDAEYITAPTFWDKPVVAFEDINKLYPPEKYDAFVAISYAQINQLRAKKCAELRAMGYNLASYVSSKATYFSNFVCGWNCFILEDNTIQPFVTIGNNVTLWSGNHIGHHSTIEDNVFIASHIVVSGHCRVKQGAFIGVNATMRDGITVGEQAVIGAGALLLKSTADRAVYPGKATEPIEKTSDQLKKI